MEYLTQFLTCAAGWVVGHALASFLLERRKPATDPQKEQLRLLVEMMQLHYSPQRDQYEVTPQIAEYYKDCLSVKDCIEAPEFPAFFRGRRVVVKGD
jgi:hypothetical protein